MTTIPEQFKEWAELRAQVLETESDTGYLDLDVIHATEDDAVEIVHTVGPVLIALAEVGQQLWFDQATAFTCDEAEAIAGLMRLLGQDADTFIASHAEGDDEGDDHYVGDES